MRTLAADVRATGSSGAGHHVQNQGGRKGAGPLREWHVHLQPWFPGAPGRMVEDDPRHKVGGQSTPAKAQLPRWTGGSQTVPPPRALCHVISSLLLCATQTHPFHAASPACPFRTAPAPLRVRQTPSVTSSVPGLSNTRGWEPHRGLALWSHFNGPGIQRQFPTCFTR